MSNQNGPRQRRYPAELRQRAVRMVQETIKQTGERHGVITRVSVQLGIGSETLRHWVKQAEVDIGQRPGVTTEHRQKWGVEPICRTLQIAPSTYTMRRTDRYARAPSEIVQLRTERRPAFIRRGAQVFGLGDIAELWVIALVCSLVNT